VHSCGLVHRDLKPSNVLLASDGPRIIDFGVSRALDSAAVTNANGVVGSPGFMSPEQAEGRVVGPPTDIFSLGGLLAFAATGEPPFGMGSPTALLYRVVYGAAATGHVPAALQPLVERCLAKDPAVRPTAAELVAELGPAAPAEGWLSWHGVVVSLARDLPPTEADRDLSPAIEAASYHEPAAEPDVARDPAAADRASSREPAATRAPMPRLAPSGHLRHAAPTRRPNRPSWRSRHVLLRGDQPR
jgi:eukaryotic-like serine/threonine-protein kinase